MNSRRTRPLEPGQTMLKQPSYSGVWAKRSPTWFLLLILSSVSSEHVPVAAKFGDSVTLPCDGKSYSLGIPEDALHVFWKTLDYRVYEFVGGKGYPDNGFQDRAEMSREKISQGDFSLTVHNTTFSDGHIYACYLLTWSRRLLQSVDLLILAHSEVRSLQSGASLSLPLYTAGPVEVLFDPGGSAQSPRVLLSRAGLPGPGYEQRVSVQNSSLTLRSLTPADQGNYTVRDLQGNTISTVIVTVGGPAPPGRTRLLSILIPVLTVLSALGVLAGLYYGKTRRENQAGDRPAMFSALRDGDDGETGDQEAQ